MAFDEIFQPLTFRNLTIKNRILRCHIPFWRAVGTSVHEHDCKFVLQLSHRGRQRDIPGIEYATALSSTGKSDPTHGFRCEAMTKTQITVVMNAFAEGARRARDANLDGVELHGANGYLIRQIMSVFSPPAFVEPETVHV